MKKELKHSFDKFNSAISRLEEGIEISKDKLDEDGVIQRFEFTFELMWKTLKLYLLQEGIITNSPKEALKEAFKFGMIENEEVVLDMLNDRNQTSHIYSEELSSEIFNRISSDYILAMKKIFQEIEDRL